MKQRLKCDDYGEIQKIVNRVFDALKECGTDESSEKRILDSHHVIIYDKVANNIIYWLEKLQKERAEFRKRAVAYDKLLEQHSKCDYELIDTDSECDVHRCGEKYFTCNEFNYCPMCGAKLKIKEKKQ